LQITAKEATVIDQDSLRGEIISLFETKSEGKILLYRFSKKWLGSITHYTKKIGCLMKMILEIGSYSE
jgi:hypothetical protein